MHALYTWPRSELLSDVLQATNVRSTGNEASAHGQLRPTRGAPISTCTLYVCPPLLQSLDPPLLEMVETDTFDLVNQELFWLNSIASHFEYSLLWQIVRNDITSPSWAEVGGATGGAASSLMLDTCTYLLDCTHLCSFV